METNQFIENLLTVLPYWQYKFVKPLRQALKDEMGLESYYALQTLNQFGSMAMTELAQRLKITKQQASKMIDSLCTHELVRRIPDHMDRRYIYIEITPTGQAALYRIFSEDSHFYEKLEKRIGKKDMEDLSQAIETLLRVLPKLD